MGGLRQLLSSSGNLVSMFYLKVLPGFFRLTVLAICVTWKHLKLIKINHKYTFTINKKSSKFSFRMERAKAGSTACSICLSDYKERDELRQVAECRHSFHRRCLDRWLKEAAAATCPLCRSLVVPDAIMSEHRQMQIEGETGGVGPYFVQSIAQRNL